MAGYSELIVTVAFCDNGGLSRRPNSDDARGVAGIPADVQFREASNSGVEFVVLREFGFDHAVQSADTAVDLSFQQGQRNILRAHIDGLAEKVETVYRNLTVASAGANVQADAGEQVAQRTLHAAVGQTEREVLVSLRDGFGICESEFSVVYAAVITAVARSIVLRCVARSIALQAHHIKQ